MFLYSRILLVTLLLLVGFPVGADRSGDAIEAYRTGEYQKALEIWMLLAYEGDAAAQYRLGVMFAEGVGVVFSPEESEYWLSRAAEQGHAQAQYRLGAIYVNGKGLRSDRDQGLEWWRAAARNGSAFAQYGLGVAYLYGAGVSADRDAAERWFGMAQASGSPEAGLLLKNLYDLADSGSQVTSASRYARVGPVAVWIYAAFNRLSVILAEAAPGSLARIVGRRDDWFQVELPREMTGWVLREQIEQVSGVKIRLAQGALLRANASLTPESPVLMTFNGTQWLDVLDVDELWLKVIVPGAITGWTPVLGLIEEAAGHISLQQAWGRAHRESREQIGERIDASVLAGVTTTGRSLEADPDMHARGSESSSRPIVRNNDVHSETYDQPDSERLTSSLRLARNDYAWLLEQAPARFTLELFASTSELLIREFYLAGEFKDHLSYFSSSIAGRRWFTLFHGSYPDMKTARYAIQTLPVQLDAIRVRRVGSVVQELCENVDDVTASVLEVLEERCNAEN